jgi:hypothetical protein
LRKAHSSSALQHAVRTESCGAAQAWPHATAMRAAVLLPCQQRGNSVERMSEDRNEARDTMQGLGNPELSLRAQ